MSVAAIEIRGVSCTWPAAEKPAVKNVNLRIGEGEFVGVIGANRAGKSTLVSLLAGCIPHLYPADLCGSVLLRGQDSREYSTRELAGQVGLVLQHPARQLSGSRYTVFEEIAFGLENLGVEKALMEERVERVLAAVGLSDFRDHSPFQLSGGQQQRLVIAAVLVLAPPVLILDEPTSFLDPDGTAQIFRLLRRLKDQGHTIVIASHRLAWLAETVDRVVVLSGGEIVLDGMPRAVLGSPLLEDIGLSRMPFTRVGVLAKADGRWNADEPLPVTFSQTVLGVRGADFS